MTSFSIKFFNKLTKFIPEMLPEKTCEWENCNQKFKRPEQLFQHVNQVHSRVSS